MRRPEKFEKNITILLKILLDVTYSVNSKKIGGLLRI